MGKLSGARNVYQRISPRFTRRHPSARHPPQRIVFSRELISTHWTSAIQSYIALRSRLDQSDEALALLSIQSRHERKEIVRCHGLRHQPMISANGTPSRPPTRWETRRFFGNARLLDLVSTMSGLVAFEDGVTWSLALAQANEAPQELQADAERRAPATPHPLWRGFAKTAPARV